MCEQFSTGLELCKEYDAFDRPIRLVLPNQCEVHYNYDPLFLRCIKKTSASGKTLYSHTYEEYDLDGNSLLETLPGNVGELQRTYDSLGRTTTLSSPYFRQECLYDPSGNLLSSTIDGSTYHYAYDGLSQLCSEQGAENLTYTHDSLHNRTSKNSDSIELNDLNELVKQGNIHCVYDQNGNQIQQQSPTQTTHFTYDPLNRLVEAATDSQKLTFFYDPLGRRLSKTTSLAETQIDHEDYLYDGLNEIGAFKTTGEPKNLRVLGHTKYDAPTLAIELENQLFFPFTDLQGNIRRLINLDTRAISAYDFSAFGEALQPVEDQNPWRFAAKRFDPELGLVYFGKRYYDPRLGRWLTTDPAGFIDSANLYQYVLNNPFKYRDPHGENVLGFLVGIAEVVAGAAVCLTGGALEVVTLGGYTFVLGFHEAAGIALMTHGAAHAAYHSQDMMPDGPWTHKAARNPTKNKEKNPPPGGPNELEKDAKWKETTHPEQKKKSNRRVFENTETGEVIEFDKRKPSQSGHRGQDHYHRRNPESKGEGDEYLNKHRKPCREGSSDSHLYLPDHLAW